MDMGRTAMGDLTSAKRAREVKAIGTVKGLPTIRVKQAKEMSITCGLVKTIKLGQRRTRGCKS